MNLIIASTTKCLNTCNHLLGDSASSTTMTLNCHLVAKSEPRSYLAHYAACEQIFLQISLIPPFASVKLVRTYPNWLVVIIKVIHIHLVIFDNWIKFWDEHKIHSNLYVSYKLLNTHVNLLNVSVFYITCKMLNVKLYNRCLIHKFHFVMQYDTLQLINSTPPLQGFKHDVLR